MDDTPRPAPPPIEEWGEEPVSAPTVERDPVSEKDLLRFAKQVLLGCVIVFVWSAVVMLAAGSEIGKEIWDFVKVAANSLVGVVIGYYFTKR